MNAVSRFEYTSKHDVQRANFINVETDFINAEKQIRLLWNLNMKKKIDLAFKSIQIWLLNLENTISGGVLWENSENFFK